MHRSHGKASGLQTSLQYTHSPVPAAAHSPQPKAIGAKVTYLMTKMSKLSHCRLSLHCSCTGNYAVAPVQCHVSNKLRTALHCTALRSSTAYPIALNIPPLRPLTRVTMRQENYIYNICITYMHVHTYMHANSQITP